MTSEREDDLRSLYLEACAQDPRRPAAQVRDAVRAHARMVLQAQIPQDAAAPAPSAPASNQDRWKTRALASVVLVGLAGLLVLQFDRGTPQEKELVAGLPKLAAPAPRNELPSVVAPAPSTTEASTKTAAATLAAGTGAAAGMTAPTGQGKVSDTATAKAADAFAAPPAALPLEVTTQAAAVAAASPPPTRMAKAAADVPASAAAPVPARGEQDTGASVATAAEPASTVPLAPMAPRAAMRSRLAGPDSLHPAQALLDAARLGQLEPLNRLLVPGAPIDALDANGQTPLMLAAMSGHLEVVRRLLAAGAQRELRDRHGQSAADHARRLGRGDIVRLLEAGS